MGSTLSLPATTNADAERRVTPPPASAPTASTPPPPPSPPNASSNGGSSNGDTDATTQAELPTRDVAQQLTPPPSPPPNTYAFPTGKLQRRLTQPGKTPLVLVACGSFSPITKLHVQMFELATRHIPRTEFEIVGNYLSPCRCVPACPSCPFFPSLSVIQPPC